MARFAEHTPPDPQYEATVKAKEEIYSFLQEKGMTNVGVGIGYNKETQKWCLAIHLQNPLPPQPDAELKKVLKGDWNGMEVRVKHVGQVIAY
jgi:hypothetical protein